MRDEIHRPKLYALQTEAIDKAKSVWQLAFFIEEVSWFLSSLSRKIYTVKNIRS